MTDPLSEAIRRLPGHEEGRSVRATTLPDRLRIKLSEAEDSGLAVNRSGWWNRTPEGDKYLEGVEG